MTGDMRSHLARADALLREQRYAEAVALYDEAAERFAEQGFLLKCAAVSRQVVTLLDGHAPEMTATRERALRRLERAYTGLGLVTAAAEVRRLLDGGVPA